MIIEMDIYSAIRTRYLDGESIRSIAKNLNISRQTVKKYCEGGTHPEVRKNYHRESDVITDKIKAFILGCFKEYDEEHLKKQNHTAKKIYDRLVAERKFIGSYSTIRTAVRTLKAERTVPPQSSVPLSYAPGEAAQIDWGEATAYIDGQKTKLYTFCGRLCYSCDMFVQVYKAANEETFLEAQQIMFDFFGGTPRRVIFDNAKVAVKEGFGIHAKPQDKYLSFSAHYAISLDFCNPASGNEKSLVENLVGYSRRNFLVPVPRVNDIAALNRKLWNDCISYREKHKVAHRAHSVKLMYKEETRFLNTIPRYRFDTSKTAMVKVDDFSTVRYEKNNYSVPTKYLRKDVTVKGYANNICILHEGAVVATYSRQYGSGNTQYRLEHYIDLLERKPRSVSNARPVKETLTKELLDWGNQLPGGNKEMVKLLRLCVDYGEERILTIKRLIPGYVVPTVDMVRTYLNEPVKSSVIYLKNEIGITKTDLKKYDEKYGVANQ
ncbi:IS21 family transposase [Sporomusa sphaeroides]|uniref:IS21 family transposase n=1 Tax=Sporomusa sphaeroides TaxID=47679 RepID=UPI002CA4A028|nr:IS21 family transposase [Sporomusa sphaeroides]HML34182.1 IS21 family transposase [Sporomusa sphaeroides]